MCCAGMEVDTGAMCVDGSYRTLNVMVLYCLTEHCSGNDLMQVTVMSFADHVILVIHGN